VLAPLRAIPFLSERVWGGTRLAPPQALPIGEVWMAGPWSEIATGPYAGRTLDAAAVSLGADLVGTAAPDRPGPRFPLLVKLLDPAAWLSVQVHPDDAVAREHAGPKAVGKTESWFVIEADPDAMLLVGARPNVRQADLREAMRRGAGTDRLLERHPVAAGDVILLPAGTLHAVGPGVLLYELQQPSDMTYRVDDWGRPASRDRPLHTAKALAALAPNSRPVLRTGGHPGRVAQCAFFTLDLVDAPTPLDPGGRTLHLVTAIHAPARLESGHWTERLEPLQTIVVPASAGAYELRPEAGGAALVAALP
jgi:mannose-6-phosphate isomerase